MTPARRILVNTEQTRGVYEQDKDAGSVFAAAAAKISDLIQQALGNRITALSVKIDWQSQAHVDIAMIVDPAHAARIVDHGPPADDPQAVKAFRHFWGAKAETRRFKDGRILESVVWDANGPAERVRVFQQIVEHALHLHLNIPKRHMHFFAPAYDRLLVESGQLQKALYTVEPAVTGFGSVMAAFDQFVKELKSLKGLPLAINSVTPISEGLRYTSTFVPGPVRQSALPILSLSGNYLVVQECVITFEGSGRWPEDFAAIQKVKAAFFTKIAEAFRTSVVGSRCEVAFDLQGASNGSGTYLDVLVPEGFAFRLWVKHARERSILENTLLDETLAEEERRDWQAALVEYHRRCTARPSHHAATAALQNRHTSFSTTVRITKRWLAAHLLLPHIAAELVELVCAKVYLDEDLAQDVPHSGVNGFARTLSLLASWSWREVPMTIPLYSAPSHAVANQGRLRFPEIKQKSVERHFTDLRKADPAVNRLAWYIATEQDIGGRAWEPLVPSKMVAARVQELARASLALLAVQMPSGNSNIAVSSAQGIAFLSRNADSHARRSSPRRWKATISCCISIRRECIATGKLFNPIPKRWRTGLRSIRRSVSLLIRYSCLSNAQDIHWVTWRSCSTIQMAGLSSLACSIRP